MPAAGLHAAVWENRADIHPLRPVMTASTTPSKTGVIAPYGGTLVDLMVPEADRAAVKASATKTLECSDRNACDVELLTVGGFSPLRGFMHQEDYDAVVSGHRLASGQLFGLPIVMDTDRDDVVVGDKLLLTYKGQDLACLLYTSPSPRDMRRSRMPSSA